jgi:exonuclease SbcC
VLEAAARDLAELKRDEAALAELELELEKTETTRAAAAGRVAELERARQENEGRARGLRESLERLGRALASDLAALRAELHAGEPCPLCGATEHPWAERAALTALGEELGAMRAELKGLEQNGERLAGDEKLARGEVAAAEGALGQLRRQRADGLKRISQRSESLEQTRQTLPGGAAALDELDGLLAASRGELAQVAGLLGEVRRLEQETEEFQKRGEQEAKAVEESGAALNELTERAHALSVRGEGVRGEIGASEEQLAGLAEELRQTLAGWPEWGAALGALPTHEDGGNLGTLREALRAEALEYRETRRRQQEAEAALQALAERRAAGEARARGLEDQLAQAQALLARRQTELEAAGRERAAVLGGRAADDAEAALNAALKQARQAHELARQTLDAARQRLSELEGTLRSLAEHLAGIQTDVTAVRARVEMFAEKARFTAEQIGQTLGLETAWLEEVRQARERLTRQREHALGQAEALRRQLEAHRAAPPPHAREDVEARRAALAQEQEKLKNELEGFLSRLAVDDQSRARLGEKRQELETAREGALVWQKLGEAIGSADGKKLRTYAQGLTLRALVAHANAHLRQLRPRYALRQNGQAPMDLVLVDRDMGGEVRTVRSLSGGESFLVSLALALGLSNMAARDLSIDSLFIDEGFGTLDGDTLQMALAVLQGLHAQGKQVGIISHVEGIAPSLGAEVSVEAVEPGRSRVQVRMAL